MKISWNLFKQYYWLVFAGVCGLFALIFWIKTDREVLFQPETPLEEQAVEEVNPEKVGATRYLGTFNNEVLPLELTKRVISVNTDHAPSFRGTSFMQKNSKRWTIELFRAKEEAVILNYFRQHPDVKDFIYTRLSGDNQEETYVLFYGNYKNQPEAQQAMSQVSSLGLPASITPTIQNFKTFTKIVNEIGSEENASGTVKVYEVELKSVALPSETATATATTATTNARPTYRPLVAPDPAPRIVQHSEEALRLAGR